MLNIGVAQLLGGLHAHFIGSAVFVAAIGNHERGFVGGQKRGELVAGGFEVDRAGNVAFVVSVGAVHIDEGNLAGGDRRLQVVMRDVGRLAGTGENKGNQR